MNRKKIKGFTLIELLVVIAIISLLSTSVMASLSSARSKARDTKRMADMKQIQTALEMYFNDYGSYPVAAFSSEPGDQAPNNGGNWIPGLTPTYLAVLPKDPLGGNSSNPFCTGWKRAYIYLGSPGGAGYKLLSHCAPEGTWTSSHSFYDPPRGSWAWQVSSDPTARASF